MVASIILGLGLSAFLAAADVPEAPTVPATQAPPAVAAIPAGQLRGSVSYGRRAPAVGAMIVVRPENAPSPIRLATTGTNGSFAFVGVPDGVYRAEVRRDGYAPVVKSGITVRAPFRAVVEILLVRGEKTAAEQKEPMATAPMEGSASLTGTIRVAGGAPLAEARVRLTRSDDDARSLLTDGAGAFEIPELKAGRWRLDLQGAGLLPVRADLDLVGDVAIDAQLAAQPPDYRPLAQDLIVPEEAIPPPAAAP